MPSRADGQAQPVSGRPQQFDLTATAAPEDEDVAGHRIVFQRRQPAR
ncbi:UNVERIFIED_ORG: hypothetical protein J2Y78_004937 [Buttiauxella agrestis ATCC 33320]